MTCNHDLIGLTKRAERAESAYQEECANTDRLRDALTKATERVNQQTQLISKLVSQLRDYRNNHHAEHPSQEGKEVCAYSWCANATRLIAESARQIVTEGPQGTQGDVQAGKPYVTAQATYVTCKECGGIGVVGGLATTYCPKCAGVGKVSSNATRASQEHWCTERCSEGCPEHPERTSQVTGAKDE